MWVVEVKIGKVWDWLPQVFITRSVARGWAVCRKYIVPEGKYRVRKYQRVEL